LMSLAVPDTVIGSVISLLMLAFSKQAIRRSRILETEAQIPKNSLLFFILQNRNGFTEFAKFSAQDFPPVSSSVSIWSV
jgi:hypothetical protein